METIQVSLTTALGHSETAATVPGAGNRNSPQQSGANTPTGSREENSEETKENKDQEDGGSGYSGFGNKILNKCI